MRRAEESGPFNNLPANLRSIRISPQARCPSRPSGMRETLYRGTRNLRFMLPLRMTIVKTSTSYFAGSSPATTSANLSSIWTQPSS